MVTTPTQAPSAREVAERLATEIGGCDGTDCGDAVCRDQHKVAADAIAAALEAAHASGRAEALEQAACVARDHVCPPYYSYENPCDCRGPIAGEIRALAPSEEA
jgi:hypothetical protein